MTLEEAKKLKPGDRVLVEATIQDFQGSVISEGYICLAMVCGNQKMFYAVTPENIREKISPPRRKFRKGDIVSRNGHLYYVAEDEKDGFNVALACWDDGIMYTRAELLTLERSVEDLVALKKKGE